MAYQSAPIPDDDVERVSALKSYGILDTPAEEPFDRITRLAASFFDAPIALVSLVDSHRQWFKSKFGLKREEIPRDISFCGHAIENDDLFIIPDATKDSRFSDNPLVTCAPNIRTYLGAPLINNHGTRLGALCVIFDKVTPVPEEKLHFLKDLAALVLDELELRRVAKASEILHHIHQDALIEARKHQELMASVAKVAKVGGWELDLDKMDPVWTDETKRIHEVDLDYSPSLDDAIRFYAPEARPIIRTAVENAIAMGKPFDLELPVITARGTSIWVRASGKAIYKDGIPVKILGAFQDITAKRQESENLRQHTKALEETSAQLELELIKQAEIAEELKQARVQAEAANIAKSQFLATMSHELRTPMNGILGMLDIALRSELPEAQKQQISIARNSASILLQLLNDILDLSKLDEGQVEIEHIPYQPRKLLEETTEFLRLTADQKDLLLKPMVAASVPKWLKGDPTRLRQILMNLIGNAIKFSEHGDVIIRMEPSEDMSRLEVAIQDFGIGIPQHIQAKLFQRFSQGDASMTRRFGGSGLGLAISKQLAELMDGDITVESIEGEGSVFTVTIALHHCTEGEIIRVEEQLSRQENAEQKKLDRTLRILVAEDNEVNQMVLDSLLKAEGHKAVMVENGRGALEQLMKNQFDLILMDVQMPEMDGVEATKAIRTMSNSSRSIPIIALTANAMQGDREKYIAAGMTDYLSKPISAAALSDKIEEVMAVTNAERLRA